MNPEEIRHDYQAALATLLAERERKHRRSRRVCPCSQREYGHTYNDHDEERRLELGDGQ